IDVDPEILAAQQNVVDALVRAGAHVTETQPETFGDLREHHAVYLRLLTAVTSARVSIEERRQRVGYYRAAGDEFSLVRVAALEAGAADFVGWLNDRERHRAAYRAFFREWDVLLSPAFGSVAFPHIDFLAMSDADAYKHPFTVAGRTTPYEWQLGYPAVATLAGQPATAFPVGLTTGGLPIGLQAIGPYLEDRTPIRFAALLAKEIGGFRRPPGYDD
ncbi:MAG: amidase, partial [Candidatus Rokubacteria bacterium]|nr:amidase [Candidatus Rokubacteria bacterium]